MLYELSRQTGDYLTDVFITKFDFWAAFGIVAQLIFTARFLVQWIASEKAERSIVPVPFWFLSIIGGTMTLIYAMVRHDGVIIIGQVFSIYIYVRNLMLIFKNRQNASS